MEKHRVGLQVIVVIILHSVHILQSCSWSATMIVFRCKKIPTHYRNYEKRDYTIDSDLLNAFDDNDREVLCKAVINANQYAHEQDARSKNILVNAPSEMHSSSSKLEKCHLRVEGRRKTIRCLRCTHTRDVKWFVAFGQPNRFMYLLEPGLSKVEPNFRITGLIEPRASVNKDRSFTQFHTQFTESKDEMEQICQLGKEDQLRICSVLFEVLNADDAMPRVNYLQSIRFCSRSMIREDGPLDLEALAKVLPCKLVTTSSKPSLRKFFVLLDSSEQGAAYVFIQTNIKVMGLDVLELHTRATGIGALLNPIDLPKMKAEAPPVDLSPGPIMKRKRSQRIRKLNLPPVDPHTSEEHFDSDSRPLTSELIQSPSSSRRVQTQQKRKSVSSVHPQTSRKTIRSQKKGASERSADTPGDFDPETTGGKPDAIELDSDLDPTTGNEGNYDKSDFETTSLE